MKQITKEWLNWSKSDLELVGKIINDENLTHLAAFHCQQSIEKALKAVLEEYSEEIPKIHNLATLVAKVSRFINLKINYKIIKTLDQLYIDARYPGELGLLPDGKPTISELFNLFEYTTQIINSISSQLK